jgi:putative lipoprotein
VHVKERQRIASACVAGLMAVALLLTACSTDGVSAAASTAPAANEVNAGAHSDAVLIGTITYAQRIILPRDATVVIGLLDLSRGEYAKQVIAEHRFQAKGQVPIRFDLPYDSSRISSGRLYGVRAEILVDGALWFVNEEPVPVLTGGNSVTAQVVVRPAAQG